MELRFSPFGEEHVEAYQRMVADPDIQRFTLVPNEPPPDYVRGWLARNEQGRRDGKSEAFAVVDPSDGSLLGVGVGFEIDRDAGSAELGYVVGPEARGRGVGTEILRRLTRWAFDELGLFRVELLISTDNEASQRVAEKCGYTHEGTLRQLYGGPGKERSDGQLWSRLATD